MGDMENDEEDIRNFISNSWNASTIKKSEGYVEKFQAWLRTKKNVVSLFPSWFYRGWGGDFMGQISGLSLGLTHMVVKYYLF